jgi:outer membrane receptor protein involved in Fe transport
MGKWPDIMPFFTSSLDSEVQLNWSPFEGNLLIGGVSHRWVTFLSENNDPDTVNEHRLGVFAHVEQRLFDQLILTGSARLDINTVTPMAFSPRLAAVWRFTPTQLVRAAFGRAFRKPSIYNSKIHVTTVEGAPGFEGLGKFIQNSIGNEDLDNESITTFEVGYRGHFMDNRLVAEADVFFNMYRNTINFYSEIATNQFGIPDLDGSFLAFQNKGQEVNSVGGSVSLTYRLKETLRLNANYTYRYSWYITDPAADSEFGKKGERVNWEPEHLLNLAFHYLTSIGLRFGLSAHGQSTCRLPFPEAGGLFDDQVEIESPARIFFNGFLSWRLPAGSGEVEAGLRAYNFLHVGFRDTPAITRWDGEHFGGELLGRNILLFVRGSI